MNEIERTIDATSIDRYRRGMAAARPRLERIASVLDTEFGCPQYLQDIRRRAEAPPEQGRAIQRELEALRAWDPTAPVPAEAAIRRFTAMRERFEALGYRRGVMLVEERLSGECDKLGRPVGRLLHMRFAVELARELGETYLACQYLGMLGDCFESVGAADSAVACYEQGLTIALAHSFPDQAARLMTFLGDSHLREGRLAVATEWIEQALRTCRELGGSGVELRFIVVAMEHFAMLDCWDVVERLLERCPIVVRELERVSADPLWLRYRHDVTRIEAQLRLARGDVEGARALFLEARRQQRRSSHQHRTILLDHWSGCLVEAGRMEDALPLVEDGLRICDRWHNDRYGRKLAIRHARVLFALGRHREAAEALADFDRRSRARNDTPREQQVEREVLEARLLAVAGDRAGARAALLESLEALRQHARRLDAGPLGYLALAAMDDVRFAVHEIAGLDAMSGYVFELQWRGLVRELGAAARSDSVASAPWALERGTVERPPLPSDATHLVFMMSRDVIVRWCATPAGIRRDTLALSPAECARRVERVLASLERGPGTPAATPLGSDAGWLARALLPETVLSAPGDRVPRLLLISADGPLEQLPFEALDRSEGGPYRPLALDFDIARLRSPAGPTHGPAPGAPAILADPIAPQETFRRFPALGRLPASAREANSALWHWDGARILRGERASKGAVLAAWKEASGIYVAAHLVHDPEVPFSPFVPLARDTSAGGPRDDCIEIADVRALDLSGCDLAVISTCSSGAPYAGSRRMGPSFGDAFVDAGAACVVQAAWAVDDARVAPLMERFLSEWRRGARDPIRALGAARRAAIQGQLGASDPCDWAAWAASVAPPWSELLPSAAPAVTLVPEH